MRAYLVLTVAAASFVPAALASCYTPDSFLAPGAGAEGGVDAGGTDSGNTPDALGFDAPTGADAHPAPLTCTAGKQRLLAQFANGLDGSTIAIGSADGSPNQFLIGVQDSTNAYGVVVDGALTAPVASPDSVAGSILSMEPMTGGTMLLEPTAVTWRKNAGQWSAPIVLGSTSSCAGPSGTFFGGPNAAGWICGTQLYGTVTLGAAAVTLMGPPSASTSLSVPDHAIVVDKSGNVEMLLNDATMVMPGQAPWLGVFDKALLQKPLWQRVPLLDPADTLFAIAAQNTGSSQSVAAAFLKVTGKGSSVSVLAGTVSSLSGASPEKDLVETPLASVSEIQPFSVRNAKWLPYDPTGTSPTRTHLLAIAPVAGSMAGMKIYWLDGAGVTRATPVSVLSGTVASAATGIFVTEPTATSATILLVWQSTGGMGSKSSAVFGTLVSCK